jgi:hypothetical protein
MYVCIAHLITLLRSVRNPTDAESFSAGFVLQQDQFFASEVNAYQLWMQGDGNLAIYRNRTALVAPEGIPIWALQMYKAWPPKYAGPYKMTLQVRVRVC